MRGVGGRGKGTVLSVGYGLEPWFVVTSLVIGGSSEFVHHIAIENPRGAEEMMMMIPNEITRARVTHAHRRRLVLLPLS